MADTQMDFDENATDPAALAAMFAQMEAGTPPVEPAVTPAPEPDQVKVEPSATEIVAEVEKEPDGIATKDGKHIIPYAVLKLDRDRANRAEQALKEAQDKLAELEAARAATGVTGEVADTNQSDANDLSDDEMETLKLDFPTVYKGLMAMQAQAKSLQEQLRPVQDSVRSAEQVQKQTMAEQVQDAIDATPKLAHIMASDPEAYELAKQFDNTLKANPAWAGKPMSDRFAKVIEMVELTNGAINIQGKSQPVKPAQKTADQLKTEAKALASAAVADKTVVPTSLSDFPAGQHAAIDEREALENMTTAQIAQKFASMSPEKMEAYLQNL